MSLRRSLKSAATSVKSLARAAVLLGAFAVPALVRAECRPVPGESPMVCWCQGTITDIFVTSGTGEVQIRPSWRNDWIRICSLTSDKFCSAWLAQAMSAQLTQKNTTLRYDFDPAVVGYSDCAHIPAYGGAPMPGYFMTNQ